MNLLDLSCTDDCHMQSLIPKGRHSLDALLCTISSLLCRTCTHVNEDTKHFSLINHVRGYLSYSMTRWYTPPLLQEVWILATVDTCGSFFTFYRICWIKNEHYKTKQNPNIFNFFVSKMQTITKNKKGENAKPYSLPVRDSVRWRLTIMVETISPGENLKHTAAADKDCWGPEISSRQKTRVTHEDEPLRGSWWGLFGRILLTWICSVKFCILCDASQLMTHWLINKSAAASATCS